MDVSSSFEFSLEFVLSVRRNLTTTRTRFVSAGLDVSHVQTMGSQTSP